MIDPIERQAALDCFHDWIDKRGDIHTPDEMAEYRAIEALPPAQTEPKWIPCSERLPDKSGKYLVTAFEGTVKVTTIVLFQSTYRLWGLTGRRAYWKVIAWMPVPDPWEGEQYERPD